MDGGKKGRRLPARGGGPAAGTHFVQHLEDNELGERGECRGETAPHRPPPAPSRPHSPPPASHPLPTAPPPVAHLGVDLHRLPGHGCRAAGSREEGRLRPRHDGVPPQATPHTRTRATPHGRRRCGTEPPTRLLYRGGLAHSAPRRGEREEQGTTKARGGGGGGWGARRCQARRACGGGVGVGESRGPGAPGRGRGGPGALPDPESRFLRGSWARPAGRGTPAPLTSVWRKCEKPRGRGGGGGGLLPGPAPHLPPLGLAAAISEGDTFPHRHQPSPTALCLSQKPESAFMCRSAPEARDPAVPVLREVQGGFDIQHKH